MQTFWPFILLFAHFSSVFLQRCVEDQVQMQQTIKLTCKNGFFQPTACVFTEQTGAIELPLNSTKIVDGFWMKCEMDGTSIRYSKEPRCVVEGKQYHINETLKTASVLYKCLGTSIEPIGCYFVDSKNQETQVKLGQTILLDNIQHRCRPGGTPDSSLNTSCLINGTVRHTGDKWDGGKGFIQECTADGYISVSECVIEPGVSVKIGQSQVYKKYLHTCTKSGTGVRYTAEPCGVAGIVCPGGSSNNVNQTVECQIDGRTLKVGDKYPSSNKGFVFRCEPDGSMVISDCVVTPGVTVEVGKSLVQQNQLHKCVKLGDRVQYTAEHCRPGVDCGNNSTTLSSNKASCQKDGQTHKSGDVWIEKPFKLQCNDGSTTVKSCIADDNTEISIGGSYRVGKSKFVCNEKPGKGASLTIEKCSGSDC